MQLVIDVPDVFVKDISFGLTDPLTDLKMILAVKLIEIGRISTGRAAEWLGISKPRFLQESGRYGLSAFDVDEQTIDEDIAYVEHHHVSPHVEPCREKGEVYHA